MMFTIQEPSTKELRERRALSKQRERLNSFHLKLFGRIQAKLCQINGGICGGATEFERTKAVMRILVRAQLVSKLP